MARRPRSTRVEVLVHLLVHEALRRGLGRVEIGGRRHLEREARRVDLEDEGFPVMELPRSLRAISHLELTLERRQGAQVRLHGPIEVTSDDPRDIAAEGPMLEPLVTALEDDWLAHIAPRA
jgi:hypothetical protein